VIFDDYGWHGPTVRVRPGVAIDMFLELWSHELEVLHVNWQVIVKRLSPAQS
jgi:hypothetical protein